MDMFNFCSRAGKVALASTLVVSALQAQQTAVRGTVVDAKGEPVIGATVRLKTNSGVGTVTDIDGKFSLNAPRGAVLVVSYIGYTTQEVQAAGAQHLNVILQEDNKNLKEVVVIGYGSLQKKDLTGSVTSISDKNFQKGAISTPSELLVGKVAGVQITSNGSPGAGSTIRIRGGASLNASNDPLIVIDGVPVDNSAASGAPSVLSTINPQDIASMNVLKDASATAIYGSRASNGVIIIETKKGKMGQNMQINFSTANSLAEASRRVSMLNADEFRSLVKARGDKRYTDLLGTANTDWQDEIYRLAFGTDNNLSISGSTKNMPYRASVGLYHQEGVLKTDAMQRFSQSFSLNPKFFDNHLSIDLNLKLSLTRNRFANKDAIGSAVTFDPTQPIYANGMEAYGGYFTFLDANNEPNILAPYNPVALLNQKQDISSVFRSLGNVKFDYKLHFFPDLKLNLNLGYDYTAGSGRKFVPANAAFEWRRSPINGQGGINESYTQQKRNLLLDFYANYNKEIAALKSRVDLMAGYSYQDWKTYTHNKPSYTAAGVMIPNTTPIYENEYPQNTLVSYYTRLNWSLLDRYVFTATVRTDGSSRFSKENRWGVFPSLALAWRINQEGFLRNVKALNDLKLRLGYGVTGQQDGIGDYSYIPGYYLSSNTQRYQLGNTFYNMYRPAAYDQNIKWEQTDTYNAGLDFGFFNNRLSGSVDVYFKKTKDLLNTIPVPAGSNFGNLITTNVGNIENKGIELTLNATPIQGNKFSWDLSYNLTINRTKITKLNAVEDPKYPGVPTGGIAGGNDNTIQIHSVGYEPYTFFVYKQLYNADGSAIEGAYADLNNDGIINERDRYHYKSASPKAMMGLSTTFTYGKWSLSGALRASLGNYIYDNITSDKAIYGSILSPNNLLANAPRTIYNSAREIKDDKQLLSDFYLHNASFLKMDNVSLSYDFGKISRGLSLRASATVQNVFTLSNYKGIDPERGIDNNLYPMPRTYSLNLAFTL